MTIRQRGNQWQADVKLPDGSRKRVSFQGEFEARRWELSALEDLSLGKDIKMPSGSQKDAPRGTNPNTLGFLFTETGKYFWDKALAANDLNRNGRMVTEYFGRDKIAAEITNSEIEGFRTYCEGTLGNSSNTTNRKLAALSKMLHVGIDDERCSLDRMPKIRRTKEGKGRLDWLSEEQEATLLKYWDMISDPFNRDLTIFLIDTGARAYVDAGKLTWENVGEDRVTFNHSKANSWRVVPTTKRVQQILINRKKQYPLSDGPFYGLTPGSLRARWDGMRQNLGWGWLTPHVLRHTCASRLVMRGVDIRRVKDWLGHEDIKTTMLYAKMAPSALFDVVNLMEN